MSPQSSEGCHYGTVEKFKKILENLPTSDYYGLRSPGLTCYLNSVLQVLFMTKDFREALKRSCSKSSTIDARLSELFTDLKKMSAKTHHIIKELGISDVYEQRDAAEYFEKILCLTSPEASKIFKGELNQRTTCSGCKDQNNSRSFFWILPLAIEDLPHKAYDVEQGLQAFFQVKVCDDNQMYCDKCHRKQDADIKWDITHHPDVLTLLLKRFSFDSERKCYVKLHCRATVPKTLNTEKCAYDLYAVVNHYGTLTGGHYTAEIQSFETGWWYCFNDDVVKSAKPQLFGSGKDSMRSSSAYLLMYRKVNEELEQTDGSDQEDQSAKTHMEEEDGESFVLHHPLKYEGCRGGEDIKGLNGDLLEWPLYAANKYTNSNCKLGEAPERPNFTNRKEQVHQLNTRWSPKPEWMKSSATQRMEVEQQQVNGFKLEEKTACLNEGKTFKKCDKVTKKPWR